MVGNLLIILSAFFSPENDRRKRLSRFVNVIYSTIWLPTRRGSCHLVIPIRLYPFTFADIVVDIIFVWEGYSPFLVIDCPTIFYTFTRSFESHEKFHGMASDTGLVETTRRPKIACDVWLIMTN